MFQACDTLHRTDEVPNAHRRCVFRCDGNGLWPIKTVRTLDALSVNTHCNQCNHCLSDMAVLIVDQSDSTALA